MLNTKHRTTQSEASRDRNSFGPANEGTTDSLSVAPRAEFSAVEIVSKQFEDNLTALEVAMDKFRRAGFSLSEFLAAVEIDGGTVRREQCR